VVLRNPPNPPGSFPTWYLRVIGTHVPQGPQSYALVHTFKGLTVDRTACSGFASDFEGDADGWTLAGAVREAAPAPGHGAESLRLGGAVDTFDEATRQVVVPNEARTQLAFWWHMTTEESVDQFGFGFDPFTVEIRNQSGAVLAVVDLRNDGWVQGTWVQQAKVDLTPWAGQTVTLAFTATNDFDLVTTFWIDDVTVTSCPRIRRTWTVPSIGSEGGWVAESSETSGVGGTVSAGDTGHTALRLGDTSADAQYRSIVSFDARTHIPGNATIVAATLRLRRGNDSGTNPFTTHGSATVAVKTGGFGDSTALAASDFQAPATAVGVGTLSNAPAKFDWSEAVLSPAGLAAIDTRGKTQFRIAFTRDDDDDLTSDYVGFYIEAQLVVTYTLD
jgi:hypothetical protein